MSNPWDRFWLRPVPPHALALTRIAIGLFLLVYAGLYIPHLTVLFSDQGLVLPLYLERFPNFAFFLAPPSPLVTHILYGIFLLAMLGIALGAFFRVSVVTVILLALYFWQIQLHLFPTSYNRILLFCLLVMLPSGAQRTFSFDQWRRSGSWLHWELVSILPQRLIALQITMTFLGVSLQKLWLPHWQSGEILAYSFISRWATPFAFWYARLPFDIHHYDFIIWVVKFIEPVGAVGLWIPRIRFVSILSIAVFLILVSAMLSIWWFLFIIPAFILFYDPEDVALRCAGGANRLQKLRREQKQ